MFNNRNNSKNRSILEKVDLEYPGFSDEVMRLDIQQLEKRIANYAKELEDSENHKAENQLLNNAKEQYEELRAPYKDVKKAISLKTKFLVHLIRERGGM